MSMASVLRSARASSIASSYCSWESKWPGCGSGTTAHGDSVPAGALARSMCSENSFSSGISHSAASGPDGSSMTVRIPRRAAW